MKKIIAHSEREANNRRASFDERFRFFCGQLLTLDQIKQKVNSELEVKYLKGYLRQEPNPIYSIVDSKMSFSEKGLHKVLKKNGADMASFKMEVKPDEKKEVKFQDYNYSSPLKPFLDLYYKRKDVITQTCLITYKGIQMEIIRWNINNSPYGFYEITPINVIPCNPGQLILREDEFYMLDLPTLLMDLALEYELRQEEIIYHAKQMRIQTMEAVLDDKSIILPPIDSYLKEYESRKIDKKKMFKTIAQSWMDIIKDYHFANDNEVWGSY